MMMQILQKLRRANAIAIAPWEASPDDIAWVQDLTKDESNILGEAILERILAIDDTLAQHRALAEAAAELDAEASADTLPPTDVSAAFAEAPSHADEPEEASDVAADEEDIPPLDE